MISGKTPNSEQTPNFGVQGHPCAQAVAASQPDQFSKTVTPHRPEGGVTFPAGGDRPAGEAAGGRLALLSTGEAGGRTPPRTYTVAQLLAQVRRHHQLTLPPPPLPPATTSPSRHHRPPLLPPPPPPTSRASTAATSASRVRHAALGGRTHGRLMFAGAICKVYTGWSVPWDVVVRSMECAL